MKKLSLKICLVIVALFGSADGVFASDLPPCPEYRHLTKSPWINCFGTLTYASGNKYVGEFKDDKFNGFGVGYSSDGRILKEGIWKDGEFQYAQKNPSQFLK